MPGIHFVANSQTGGRLPEAEILELQERMKHDAGYRAVTVLSTDHLFLGYTGYEHYPVVVFDMESCHVVLEGHVYNREARDVADALRSIAKGVAAGRDVSSEVRQWVTSTDGDFIVLILCRTQNSLVLFNDAMGRLPIYFNAGRDQLSISREVKFVAKLIPQRTSDRLGIAQTLFFGYTLGDRTLVNGVSRMELGSLMRVDLRTLTPKVETVFSLNFDEYRHAGKPVSKLAEEMKELFQEACRRFHVTFGDRLHVVSLSGGLDSRSVLAGMVASGAHVEAATYQDKGTGSRGLDAIIAEKVAAAIGVPWHLLDIAPPQLPDIERLLFMKDGMNHAGMAFLLPFFDNLRSRFGPGMVYQTGDVGDRSMETQDPPRRLRDFDDVVACVLKRNSRMDFADIEAFLGMGRDELQEDVRRRLRQYPENDPNGRFTHFNIAERLASWNWQAEDRNRYWFWSATPFSAFSVFHYAMNVPPAAKKFHRFYQEFMARLCPTFMPIDNANWRAPFGSYKQYSDPILLPFFGRLPPRLRRFIQNHTMYRGLRPTADELALLRDHLARSPAVQQYLSPSAVEAFVLKGCNQYCFHNLLTVAGYIRCLDERP
jgi:asparagine synthase (glutamine-hydrolysing)